MLDQEFPVPALLGRYRPLELIGRGGMATVHRAIDEVLGREVAVKVFRAGAETDFERHAVELRTLSALNHHGIVTLIDAGIDDSSPGDLRPFLVMELVNGRNLEDVFSERRLPAREVGQVAYDVAEALEYVHAQGIVHRDIKPSNIILVDYGTPALRSRARLTDFGIALDATAVQLLPEEVTSGTPAYLSPEQARGEMLTPASDVYSLGLVLVQCFTGALAFPGESPIASAVARLREAPIVPDDLPGDWSRIIASMTLLDPAARPDIAELAHAFRQETIATMSRHKVESVLARQEDTVSS